MLVKGLKAPEGLTINFAPSPRQSLVSTKKS